MSLKGVWNTAVADLVALSVPFAMRAGGRGRLVASAEGESLAFWEIPASGPPRRLKGAPRRKAANAIELRLPASAVLHRRLTLPAAGREFLEPILDHRLEKLVPWAPERALYGYRVVGETESGELEVELAATSRDIAESWLAKAASAGVEPTALGSAAEPVEEPLALDLWRGDRDRVQAKARRFVKRAAAAVALVLAPLLALSIYASWSADERLASIEARSAAARRTLQIAAGAGAGSREAALIRAKTPDQAMVTLIDKLARAVPQDTALRDLEIDETRIRLAGASAAAPGLIAKLEASGVMRDTRFAAPVTRSPDGRDLFEILGARLRPERPQTTADPARSPEAGL